MPKALYGKLASNPGFSKFIGKGSSYIYLKFDASLAYVGEGSNIVEDLQESDQFMSTHISIYNDLVSKMLVKYNKKNFKK